MMEGAKTLWLFLLLNHLPLCPVGADAVLSTTQIYSQDYSQDQRSSPTLAVSTTLRTSEDKNSINGTRGDCLVDTEMGLIAISSAGGLIVCLLAATVVLACQVCSLQRQVYCPRTSRSNMDLVSSTGYWGTDQPEIAGLVGPYDASVMLEEVKEDKTEEERQAETKGTMEDNGAGLKEGAMAIAFNPEDDQSHMHSSNFKDSCLEIPRDLEDMPLVV